MAKAKVLKLKKPAAALPPGIHAGKIELSTGDACRVRVAGVGLVSARRSPDLAEDFLEECMRDQRTVLLAADAEGGALLLGALQTSRATARDDHDTVRLEGKRLELRADEAVSLSVGKATIRLDKSGAVKIVGDRMTMDIAAVVRVLSALVELP